MYARLSKSYWRKEPGSNAGLNEMEWETQHFVGDPTFQSQMRSVKWDVWRLSSATNYDLTLATQLNLLQTFPYSYEVLMIYIVKMKGFINRKT